MILAAAPLTTNYTLMVAAARSARKAGFETHNRRRLATYLPHLQQSFQVCLRILELEGHQRNLEDLLNLNRHGVVLLDRFKRVVYANAAAETIFRGGDRVHARHGQLVLNDPNAERGFQRALDNALAFPAPAQAASYWTFRAPSHSGHSQLEFPVRPIH